jgi:hypothetical protein
MNPRYQSLRPVAVTGWNVFCELDYRSFALSLKPSFPAGVQIVHVILGNRQGRDFEKPRRRIFAVLNCIEKQVNGANSPFVDLLREKRSPLSGGNPYEENEIQKPNGAAPLRYLRCLL